jgi:hypothetical protein
MAQQPKRSVPQSGTAARPPVGWVARALRDANVTLYRVAAEYGEGKNGRQRADRSEHPQASVRKQRFQLRYRTRIRGWRDERGKPDADSAFGLGFAFRRVGSRIENELTALLHSGRIADFVATLDSLARTEQGARLAVELYIVVPWASVPLDEPNSGPTAAIIARARSRLSRLLADDSIPNPVAREKLPYNRAEAVHAAFVARDKRRPNAVPTPYLRRAGLYARTAIAVAADARGSTIDEQLASILVALLPWAEQLVAGFANRNDTGWNARAVWNVVALLRVGVPREQFVQGDGFAESTLQLDLEDPEVQTGHAEDAVPFDDKAKSLEDPMPQGYKSTGKVTSSTDAQARIAALVQTRRVQASYFGAPKQETRAKRK